MIDHIRQIIRSSPSPGQARNLVREYLQARILGTFQREGAFGALAFHGGTALRFLHGLARYSEDLDFALERPGRSRDFASLLEAARAEMAAEGYAASLKLSDSGAVLSGFVRFSGLLQELGLAGPRDRDLSIKVEVDTQPPASAVTMTTLVRRHLTLNIQHHDPGSLLAGKLHALLHRPYLKGRDVFDLLWYLSDPTWPQPNLVQLNNALAQTRDPVGPLDESDWRQAVSRRIEGADWRNVVADVEPFIESAHDSALLTRERILAVLR